MLLPYHITNGYGYDQGDWSYANSGNNGSIIKVVVDPAKQGRIIRTQAYFDLTDVTYTADHGQYRLYLPLTEGISFVNVRSALSALNASNALEFGQAAQLYFDLQTSDRNAITGSIPPFSLVNPESLFRSNYPLQQVEYNMTANHYSSIILSYTNSDDVDFYQLLQNVAFLLLGVGIPLTVGSAVDFSKERARGSMMISEARSSQGP
jgi:hypothetical protein